jgi:hypothetical protein
MLIRLDKVGAFNHIENIVIPEDGVLNGSLLQVGAYGGFDYKNGLKITDITAPIVVVAEEFMNLTGIETEANFAFKSGDKRRGYHLLPNDEITMTIDGITGASNASTMVGQFVIPVVGSYLGKINATASGSLCFQVLQVTSLDGNDALKLKVV